MSASSRMVEVVPVGEALRMTGAEQASYPLNDVHQYRTWESTKILQFQAKWDGKQSNIEREFQKKLENIPSTASPQSIEKIKKSRDDELATLRNKKSADWGTVLKELEKMKALLLSQPVAGTQALQEMHDTDLRIPEQGRWVTFPLWNTNDGDKFLGTPVTITWTLANRTFKEVYYKTTCWFGNLDYDRVLDTTSAPGNDPQPAPVQPGDASNVPAVVVDSNPLQKWKASIRLAPFGETELYIAAEFIEQRYQGAPHLASLHLRDRFPPETKWAYMRIGHAFHYGQNYQNPTYRYLVYHPFVRVRNIPQGSFADNLLLNNAKSASSSAAASQNQYIAPVGTVARAMVDLVGSLTSDPLWRFKALVNEELLYDVNEEVRKREVAWNKEDRSVITHLNGFMEEIKVVVAAEAVAGMLQGSVEAESGAASKEEADALSGEAAQQVALAVEYLEEQFDIPNSDAEPLISESDSNAVGDAIDSEKDRVVEGADFVSLPFNRQRASRRTYLSQRGVENFVIRKTKIRSDQPAPQPKKRLIARPKLPISVLGDHLQKGSNVVKKKLEDASSVPKEMNDKKV